MFSVFLNNFFGDFKRFISNFNDGSTLELALWILKESVQSLFMVTMAVVSLPDLKSISTISVGSGTLGVLYFGRISLNGKFSVPFMLYACISTQFLPLITL